MERETCDASPGFNDLQLAPKALISSEIQKARAAKGEHELFVSG